MKKLSISLLVMLLIASLFTSCSMGSDDASDVRVKVKITPSGGGRSLNTEIETINLDDDSIIWHYSATKESETQFNYGATSDSILPKDGIVTLSQGQWNIELRGFKDGKKVYAGTTSKVTIKWNFYEPNVTVPVPVKQNTGDNGYIVLNNVLIYANDEYKNPNYASIVDNQNNNKTEILSLNGANMRIECAPGSHTITFEYRNNNSTISSKSLVVTVISGRETTISGNIEKGEITNGASSAPTSDVQVIEVKKEAEVKVETSVAPATTSTTGTKTTVTFPAGSFNADSANAVLNLSVKSAGSEFSVTSSGTSVPVAGIDISLFVDGNEVSSFNNQEVVIETYIAKNLTNVSVNYNGTDGGQPTLVSYDLTSGKLVFTTTHFSEYYVLSDDVCYVVETNTAYNDLNNAAKGAKGKTLVLINDIGEDYAKKHQGDYYIHLLDNTIFKGNGHTISGFSNKKIIFQMRDSIIENLEINYSGDGFFVWKVFTTEKGQNIFRNVKAKGNLKVSGNTSLFVIYDFSNTNKENKLIFEDCVSEATMTGIGGYSDYNSLFVGYPLAKNYVFKNCINKGSIVCGKASMFLGNASYTNINLSVDNCVNEGTIISTYVDNGYRMNYYLAMKNSITTLILNDVSYPITNATFGNVPGVTDEVTPGVTTINQSNVYNGPLETGMKLTRTENNTFQITPATNGTISGKQVAKYTVGVGLYVNITNGSNRFFATEDITVNETTNWETTMKDLKFVDATFVGGGTTRTEGNNTLFVSGNESYYVVGEDENTNGQPKSASIYYLSAFDAEGNLLASVSLTSK